MMQLNAEKIMTIFVTCAPSLDVGASTEGVLRVIPIVGGDFEGQNIKGTVVSGGADWNTSISDTVSHVFAKYLLKTDDGYYIAIENAGIIDNTNTTAKIKTTPKFIVNKDSKYSWLNTGVYVGSLEGAKDPKYLVEIHIYRML